MFLSVSELGKTCWHQKNRWDESLTLYLQQLSVDVNARRFGQRQSDRSNASLRHRSYRASSIRSQRPIRLDKKKGPKKSRWLPRPLSSVCTRTEVSRTAGAGVRTWLHGDGRKLSTQRNSPLGACVNFSLPDSVWASPTERESTRTSFRIV